MLTTLHNMLERMLYERGGLPDEVQVSFERPTREWVESQLRPTLNLFLFDIQENMELRTRQPQTTRGENGAQTRFPPRRFELRYLVTAFAAEPADEHLIIWRVLAVLARFVHLPEELVPAEWNRPEAPLVARVANADAPVRPSDLWGALELPPRPALIYTLIAPLDLEIAFSAPLVLTRSLRYAQRSRPDLLPDPAPAPLRLGGVVRGRDGQPLRGARVGIEGRASETLTDAEGRFALGGLRPGNATLRVVGPGGAIAIRTVEVPGKEYDLLVDE